MGKSFYVADLHEGHANIIKFDNRPFADIEEMRAKLIENWNNRVTNEDLVYILGDESWYSPSKPEYTDFFAALNGKKILIRGNHTARIGGFTKTIKQKCGFTQVCDYLEVDDNGRQVILSHYPIAAFKNSYYGAYHLYGHVHMTYEWELFEQHKENVLKQGKLFNAFNVGASMPYMDYGPRTLDEIVNFNNN